MEHYPDLVLKTVKKNSGTEIIAEKLMTVEFWQNLVPYLTISTRNEMDIPKPLDFSDQQLNQLTQMMVRDGYFQIDSRHLKYDVCLDCIAQAAQTLHIYGLHPMFLLAFDEVWIMFHQLSSIIEKAVGGNKINYDFYAWYVDPNLGATGFPPHRGNLPLLECDDT